PGGAPPHPWRPRGEVESVRTGGVRQTRLAERVLTRGRPIRVVVADVECGDRTDPGHVRTKRIEVGDSNHGDLGKAIRGDVDYLVEACLERRRIGGSQVVLPSLVHPGFVR